MRRAILIGSIDDSRQHIAYILVDNEGDAWIFVIRCTRLAARRTQSSRPKSRSCRKRDGKAATVRLCGSCHAAEIVMSRRESREGWSGVVEDMILRGAKGSDDEFGEVVDYLVAHFPKGAPVPKINVNKAERTISSPDSASRTSTPMPSSSIAKKKARSNPSKTFRKFPESMRRRSKRKRTSWNSSLRLLYNLTLHPESSR